MATACWRKRNLLKCVAISSHRLINIERRSTIRFIHTTDKIPKSHHKAGFRARTALAQEWLRRYGFRLANVNPLRRDGLMTPSVEEIESALPTTLSPLVQPFLKARTNQSNALANYLPSYLEETEEGDVLVKLLTYYCSGIGYEIMHCATEEERQFFIQAAEEESNHVYSDSDILWCFEQLLRAGEWERLLSRRYPTCRRFSLEGLEAGILALNTILDTFSSSDTMLPQKRAVLGTLHRGRVNMLHTVLQKSVASLLNQWDATSGPTYDDITLGHSVNISTRSGQGVHLSLLNMPAHLESQDAAVNGKAYGHMVSLMLSETGTAQPLTKKVKQCVLPVIIHGDCSFCGQGIVSETLQLSTYKDFDCGGTVHVILNNQIGFTAETQTLRTSRLTNASDLALAIHAPVLHVNAEKPLDVQRAARLATLYRQRFGKDVLLDLWGFRKHGHNEVDEPRITNVSLYQEVDLHKPAAEVFGGTLTGTLRQDCQQLQKQIEEEYRAPSDPQPEPQNLESRNEGEWLNVLKSPGGSSDGVTGVDLPQLKAALSVISEIPEGFTLPPPTQRAISRRAEILEGLNNGKPTSSLVVDWATAELLALSTLSDEGHFVRLCGQDSQRGTFTQRHAVWHDNVTGQTHTALPRFFK